MSPNKRLLRRYYRSGNRSRYTGSQPRLRGSGRRDERRRDVPGACERRAKLRRTSGAAQRGPDRSVAVSRARRIPVPKSRRFEGRSFAVRKAPSPGTTGRRRPPEGRRNRGLRTRGRPSSDERTRNGHFWSFAFGTCARDWIGATLCRQTFTSATSVRLTHASSRHHQISS